MFIASHLWHPIIKRHLNISMKSIQVLKILLNKFYGKYYTYFNIIFIILRFITDKKIQWSPGCVGPHLSQWMQRFILFTDNHQVSWRNTSLGFSRVQEESWRQIVRLQYWWIQIHFKIILIFNFIDNEKKLQSLSNAWFLCIKQEGELNLFIDE